MNLSTLKRLVAKGEGPQLEFKRSTGGLRGALQTVCGFLNGDGGTVLFGVKPDGTLIGQEVSDQTLREITQALDGFEPPVRIKTDRVRLPSGREVLIFRVEGTSDTVPFTFEGRAYERVESTTRRMPQRRYEQLLLDRAHSRRRGRTRRLKGRLCRTSTGRRSSVWLNPHGLQADW